jgi:hypothetical protein
MNYLEGNQGESRGRKIANYPLDNEKCNLTFLKVKAKE